MDFILLAGFALLVAAFLIGLYQLWRVHRRGLMREKEIATKMMALARKRSDDDGMN